MSIQRHRKADNACSTRIVASGTRDGDGARRRPDRWRKLGPTTPLRRPLRPRWRSVRAPFVRVTSGGAPGTQRGQQQRKKEGKEPAPLAKQHPPAQRERATGEDPVVRSGFGQSTTDSPRLPTAASPRREIRTERSFSISPASSVMVASSPELVVQAGQCDCGKPMPGGPHYVVAC